jgi:L-asparaginase II
MTNPVLIEVLRGSIVESAHRGAVCVADAHGRIVWEVGDTQRPVFPRSAVKAIQALPVVESGAADAYGFGDRELALACASHSGEVAHAELARDMLARAGLDEGALECGTHWPMNRAAADMLLSAGSQPCALHNNCSGKHSGFLCTCVHAGMDYHGYVRADHPEQELVRAAMEAVTGAPHTAENRGIDGCSIPTYTVPLRNLAQGFARMVSGNGLEPVRAKAAERLLRACMAEPFLVSGTGRADVALMEAAPGRIFVKTGAEGVYCAALPELGYGIALKCEDGTTRASEAMVAAVLARFLAKDERVAATLNKLASPILRNWNGIEVASLRPTAAFS